MISHFKKCLLLIIGLACVMYGQEKTDADYIKLDLAGIAPFARLRSPETYSLPDLKAAFAQIPAYASWEKEENLGFGAKRLILNKGLGATTIYIDLLLYRNSIAHYEVGLLEGGGRDKAKNIDTWTRNGGAPLTERPDRLVKDGDVAGVWATYKATISRRLERFKDLTVPKALSPSYQLLTNPLENSSISTVPCDDGQPAIEMLETANRYDLIENVLRGYNPGGRIYAAISLLRRQRAGHHLTHRTLRTIGVVVELDADASTCHGDIGTTGLRARDIVDDFLSDKEWRIGKGHP